MFAVELIGTSKVTELIGPSKVFENYLLRSL
jgi:hypothetical protein